MHARTIGVLAGLSGLLSTLLPGAVATGAARAATPRAAETSEHFFRWVSNRNRQFHLGRTRLAVHRAYYRELRDVMRHPAGRGRIGPDEVADATLVAGYTVAAWPYVATMLQRLVHRDDAGLVLPLIYHPGGPGADNDYAMYLATECTDTGWPQRFGTWRRDAWRQHRRAPFLTWPNAWFNMPCRTWSAKPHRHVVVDGSHLNDPVLLVNETLDGATPFSGALEVRRRFSTARLVAGVGGTTHAPGLSGQPCIDGAIAAYLRDGTVPPRKAGARADKRCPALTPSDFMRRARVGHDGALTVSWLARVPRPGL